MSVDATVPHDAPQAGKLLDQKPHRGFLIAFAVLIVFGLAFIYQSISGDLQTSGILTSTTGLTYALLFLALLIALGFEFVNGFHDTANAVATVIYTRSLPPQFAVIWSGVFNFLGVLMSSGTVAFGIITLLPVELILQVGSSAGFAMVFALLIAAILWNLGTWWLGLPASSSHTLIGSIIGVGIANALMHGRDGTSGVDWAQATKIGYSLMLSPLIGFACSALLLLILKAVVRDRQLFEAPKGHNKPPFWIRGLLVLTCTGVSYAHGSNDGQKGMGLIMLILVGTVPLAYALNHAMPMENNAKFIAIAQSAHVSLDKNAKVPVGSDMARHTLEDFIRTKTPDDKVLGALSTVVDSLGQQIKNSGNLAKVPNESVGNVRNDMYLVSETIRVIDKDKSGKIVLDDDAKSNVKAFKQMTDDATKFIPVWVKVAVAIALGLGTMIGWKRIVVTVGEKIGKSHMTYGQGASAELVAMLTIGAADAYGLPVSTTHVLSSGVAGTMAANRSGLQWQTIRNLLTAWVLTLPCAICLSAGLFYLFSSTF